MTALTSLKECVVPVLVAAVVAAALLLTTSGMLGIEVRGKNPLSQAQ